MLPTETEALILLKEAETHNPGPWVNHSLNTGIAARIIAKACNMDENRAYIYGLLHDIGRREGVYDLHHTIYGYNYLKELGYEEVGSTCLTHSFVNNKIDDFNGEFDCSNEEVIFLREYISNKQYDEYDKLIQLCDYLALPRNLCIIEQRMIDVALRRGINELTIEKWKKVFLIKKEFEAIIGESIYNILPNIQF